MLAAVEALERPVDVARLLVDHGLPLRAAHRVVTRLAGGDEVPLQLPRAAGQKQLINAFSKLGIAAHIHRAPDTVDVRAIRERLDLSQAEFSARFCIDLRTLQNWEQGRSSPDRYARTLLLTIARDPAPIEATLTVSE